MTGARRFTRLATATSLFVCALGVCTVRADAGADEEPAGPDEQLLAAWWRTAEMIDQGEPWPTCHDHLAAAISRFDSAEPNLITDCQDLVDDIELAIRRATTTQPATQPTKIDACIDHLPESHLEIWLVRSPIQCYGDAYAWDLARTRLKPDPNDPAWQLYAVGRAAIPTLIKSLTNRTPTRSVQANPEFGVRPAVARVGDIAFALIQGISGCEVRMHQSQPTLISQLPPDERDALIAHVRQWWTATHDLDPVAAMVWTIQNNHYSLRTGTVEVLLNRGENDAAIHALRDIYIFNDDLNAQLSAQMIRAGSREPLEYIHRATAAGRPLTRNMIRVITEYGGVEDFKLLVDQVAHITATRERSVDEQMGILVTTLHYTDRALVVPVLVAVLNRYVESLPPTGEPTPLPRYVNQAAETLQGFTGVAFGFHAEDGPQRGLAVVRQMLEWWNREGQASYGLERSRPHGPSGIQ